MLIILLVVYSSYLCCIYLVNFSLHSGDDDYNDVYFIMYDTRSGEGDLD